jgi:mono/diheme cytochrome c family protein
MPGDGGFSVDGVNASGVLKAAKWIRQRELGKDNQAAVGREIFRVECESCHTTDAYRGIKRFLALRQWDQTNLQAMLGSLDLMHNGVMPPFAGTDAERAALAAYLNAVGPVSANASAVANDGHTVFNQNCSMCHRVKAGQPVFKELPRESAAAVKALRDLTGLFPAMPDLKLSEPQRVALVQWIDTQRPAKDSGRAAPGGK